MNFPSSVGMVPVSLLFCNRLRKRNIEIIILKIIVFYKFDKFDKFPSSVGIVPESLLV